MNKQSKKCPHVNIVQHGGDTEIRTYCIDSNECLRIIKHTNGKHKITTYKLIIGNYISVGTR